ncbi:MAG: type II toxin-antitoxin system RelE/ParE family toxin [Burkholderiales bacterium]
MPRKPVTWLGDSRQAVKEFPRLTRQRAGRQLARVQDGLEPESWKPMPSIGLGVNEICVHAQRQYRVIYVAKLPEAVYVLHAFVKKAQRTPKPDIELARSRFRALLNERKQK